MSAEDEAARQSLGRCGEARRSVLDPPTAPRLSGFDLGSIGKDRAAALAGIAQTPNTTHQARPEPSDGYRRGSVVALTN